ncbi:beta-galactosidase [Ruegeria sp. HKCCD4332]|uniref:beta-galactosidase n=1 Tax=Ruegeria sp. HKCCD4332 TaxID=2683021 RepID=UPI00149163BB|nr:beta-galactosidase [Ruegeria sp. HKCCD4332]NOD76821.1 beta-galactosidase [Ruegeria sp. HKCCD4332]
MSKLELGVCYYPEQWDPSQWRDDAKRMVEMGLDWVRIAEFTWGLIEPARGQFRWDWLDEVVEILGDAGLKVMMSTPTAAPPKWLIDEHPEILPVGPDGRVRGYGARRHYCFSSEIYLSEAQRIATEYARRYGTNPQVHAWQIDNEYNDHGTVLSYSEAARIGFRRWLEQQYGTIDVLNQTWGTVFWGSLYSTFEQIELPIGLVAAPNPTQALDFMRYSSDRVRLFNKAQVDVLRKYAPGREITHNFMAGSFEFDHHAVAADLDVVGFDSYPLGNLMGSTLSDDEKRRYLRTGAPDYQGFHCDLYRSQGRGRMWILEQQPGPVDWAAKNPAPAAGMVRLWTWAAYAHGAQAVMFFRWRQAKLAQEQYHTALLRSDNSPDQAATELAQIVKDRNALPPVERCKAKVAILLDYSSIWAADILPHDEDFPNAHIFREWYAGLRQLGADVDFLGPEDDLDGYALILLPQSMIVSANLAARISDSGAKLVIGARSGSKTPWMHTPENLAPGALAALTGVRVTRVESLPHLAQETVQLADGQRFAFCGWREIVETKEYVLARFDSAYCDGSPAVVRSDRAIYLAMIPRDRLLLSILRQAMEWAGISTLECDPDIRMTRRGNLQFAFNFGDVPKHLPDGEHRTFLLGADPVGARDLAVWQEDVTPKRTI